MVSCGDRVAGSGLYTHRATAAVLHLVCLEARIQTGAPWVGKYRMPSLVVVESRRTSARHQTQPHRGPTHWDAPGHLSVTPAWGNRASFCKFPAYIIPLSPPWVPDSPTHTPDCPLVRCNRAPASAPAAPPRQTAVGNVPSACHLVTACTHPCLRSPHIRKTCRNPPHSSGYGIGVPRLIFTAQRSSLDMTVQHRRARRTHDKPRSVVPRSLMRAHYYSCLCHVATSSKL